MTSIEGLIDYLAGFREARTVALTITDGWLLTAENPQAGRSGRRDSSASTGCWGYSERTSR